MATISSFEDLEIWKKAHELAALVYHLCEVNQKIVKDYSFKDQIKRASLSVSNNIAEGFEYNNNADFHRFLRISKGSCGEVTNCLLFSIKINYCTTEEISNSLELSKTLSKQIGAMMKYLRQKISEKKLITKAVQTSKPVTPNS